MRRVYPATTASHRRGPLAGLALSLLLSLAPAAHADAIYKYVDPRGVVHFTNVAPPPHYHRVASPRGFLALAMATRAQRRSDYDDLIRRAAHVHGLPPAMVKAVIRAESGFDPTAVSRKGAMGLMQLMPETASMLGVAEPFSAEDNIWGGVRYLRDLHARYGSWSHALAAYNAGPKAVDRYQGIPPYEETRDYVRRVLSYYRQYHGDFAR